MTETCSPMPRDDEDSSPEKCRQRRRRRMEMRRLATMSASDSPPPTSVGGRRRSLPAAEELGFSVKRARRVEEAQDAVAASSSSERVPSFGLMSVAGRSREMEDMIHVETCICRPEFTGRLPVNFFGVYDGHGGHQVATLCRDKMHVLLEEELMRDSPCTETEENVWRTTMKRTFERMDELAINACACGSLEFNCKCNRTETAQAGSTAVVVLVTLEHIVVANCGDSRAILCRDGRSMALSSDHKPDRPDELHRIIAAGGRVIFVDGPRVEGILAMSRAIGDRYLKPMVTWEPEISFTKREERDNCVILASDGLWDVVSSELACEVACKCLGEVTACAESYEEEGMVYPSRSAMAAALLARLALGRKSSDNISVIVVDLKRCQERNPTMEVRQTVP